MGRAASGVLIRLNNMRGVVMMMTVPACHDVLDGAEVIRSARHGCAYRAPDGEQHGKQQQ